MEPDEALDRAAEILEQARHPVVLGLTQTSTETVTAALALADRIGRGHRPGHVRRRSRPAPGHPAGRREFRRPSARVKNRADVVLFWGAIRSRPTARHWERYSVEPRGPLHSRRPRRPDDRRGRSRAPATAERADLFLSVAPEAELATLSTVQALLHGALASNPVGSSGARGWTAVHVAGLTDRLKAAKYGAWFYDTEPRLRAGRSRSDRGDADFGPRPESLYPVRGPWTRGPKPGEGRGGTHLADRIAFERELDPRFTPDLARRHLGRGPPRRGPGPTPP